MALTFTSGMRLTPARLNALLPIEAVKTADTSRASTTTLTADPELVITGLVAGAVYQLEGQLIARSATSNAGDIQYDWTYPAGCALTWAGPGPHNGMTSGSAGDGEWIARIPSDLTTIPYATSSVPTCAHIRGRLVTGGTAGTLTLRWAQQGSNASATILLAGSWIQLRRTS